MASFSFDNIMDMIGVLAEFLVHRPAERSAKGIGPDCVWCCRAAVLGIVSYPVAC
jgi:hypothetical protein